MKNRLDANTESYELVTIFGHPVIFSNLRLDRSTVPNGLYMYEIRHDDDCQGDPVQVAKWIMVNFWGTILTDTPIELEDRPNGNAIRDIEEDDWNYEAITLSLDEYMKGAYTL